MFQHRIVPLRAGETITIILPSGVEIDVEVTNDATDVVHGDRVLYSEEADNGNWHETWPTYTEAAHAPYTDRMDFLAACVADGDGISE